MKYQTNHILKIPSLENRIEFREYTVGEEKDILIIDNESDENRKYYQIKNLVKKCLIDQYFDLEKISQSEVIYIFINIRIHSVAEETLTNVPCPVCLKPIEEKISELEELKDAYENSTDHEISKNLKAQIKQLNTEIQKGVQEIYTEVKVNLSDIKLIIDEKHSKRINLSDKLKLDMKYGMNNNNVIDYEKPSDILSEEEFINYQAKKSIEILAYCIDTIYDDEEILSDLSIKDKVKIVEELPAKYLKKLTSFLLTQPKIEHKGNCTCKVCGNNYEYNLSGINDFF